MIKKTKLRMVNNGKRHSVSLCCSTDSHPGIVYQERLLDGAPLITENGDGYRVLIDCVNRSNQPMGGMQCYAPLQSLRGPPDFTGQMSNSLAPIMLPPLRSYRLQTISPYHSLGYGQTVSYHNLNWSLEKRVHPQRD